ncbi:uncharacterized protein LOC130975129 [Arachis stenosperma]|uniref:uncharacterized protein LOC130975129 n=1 Tax=Arachis stenosperma TaxID=217475 RepID=UPI0025ABDFEA|nr:uncharacterized protein LOC130975129 [Arachis stenosperma]
MTTMNAVAEAVREAAVAATRAVERLGVRNGNENEHGEDSGNDENNLGHLKRPMTLETFLKVKSPKFKGTLVATDADNWFRAIERSLRAQHVLEGQHVEFATYMLEGEAEHWWQGIQRLLQQDEEYARKFDDLCRFSKIYQGNPADFEEWKCLKFEGGLREDLMSSVVPLEIRDFAKLVNECKLVEECAKKRRNPQVGNAPARPMGRNGGRPRQDTGKRPQQAQVNTACRQCGRDHGNRPCLFGISKCYICNEPGHMAKNCSKRFTQNPARTQQQGRVFVMIADDAMQSDALIQEVILGLDWLSKYHVFLDCYERTAIIPSNGLDIKPFLSHTLYLNSVRVTLDGSDFEGYILLAASSNDSELSLERIRVVKEFPDVFLDDILEFPPQREIEFSIELVPRTGPISIAPYRMSPLELA